MCLNIRQDRRKDRFVYRRNILLVIGEVVASRDRLLSGSQGKVMVPSARQDDAAATGRKRLSKGIFAEYARRVICEGE